MYTLHPGQACRLTLTDLCEQVCLPYLDDMRADRYVQPLGPADSRVVLRLSHPCGLTSFCPGVLSRLVPLLCTNKHLHVVPVPEQMGAFGHYCSDDVWAARFPSIQPEFHTARRTQPHQHLSDLVHIEFQY